MYNFENGRLVNREVESALQEVQDVLNLVDVLARATGHFLNTVGESTDEKCFSDNVSQWLFEKKQGSSFAAIRRRDREMRAAQAFQSCPDLTAGQTANESESFTDVEPTPERQSKIDLDLLRKREEAESRARYGRSFSSSGSYADGQNMSTSYYSSQLLSHSLSSTNSYSSPRSRYLESQAAQLSHLRSRISTIKTTQATPKKSACELVGPISPEPRISSTGQNKRTSGITVSLSGGGYSNIRSCIAKSKGMFEDFASPSNPNYKSPWERSSRNNRSSWLRRNHW
uniref:DNA mismatch repair protein MutS n=1 Tax=Lygus hesperus TaxID=30085 RepID=A0A0A9XDS1_LYGHE